MRKFWNLKTQFVAVLVVLLLGALLLQNYVHELNKDRLLVKVERTAQKIADEVTQHLNYSVRQEFPLLQVHAVEPGRNVRTRRVNVQGQARIRLHITNDILSQIQSHIASLQLEREKLKQQLLIAIRIVAAKYNPEVQDFESHQRIPVLAPFDTPAADETLLAESVDWPEATDGDAAEGSGKADVELNRDVELNSTVSRIGLNELTSRASSSSLSDPRIGADIDITDHLDEVQAVFDEYRRIDLLATVGIFICGIAAALYLSFRITRPVYEVVDAFERVADGDLATRVDERNPGEFSVLATQFNRMVESLDENRELERELAQRERLLHMGDLAAGVAHDVRNPLNAIHLNIGHVRDEFLPTEESDRERFLRFTSDVQREVERLNQLVSNFLSLAQPSASSPELVDPNRLIHELDRLLRKEARGRNVALSLDLESELSALSWDRQEMMSAFLNVAMNALQAMEPDGGSLDVLSGFRAGDRPAVAITFVDTGRGISEEDLDRVFVPYFTTRRGGTGLGMAIARRITERNGGRLELESEVGRGTSVAFVFDLESSRTVEPDSPGGVSPS